MCSYIHQLLVLSCHLLALFRQPAMQIVSWLTLLKQTFHSSLLLFFFSDDSVVGRIEFTWVDYCCCFHRHSGQTSRTLTWQRTSQQAALSLSFANTICDLSISEGKGRPANEHLTTRNAFAGSLLPVCTNFSALTRTIDSTIGSSQTSSWQISSSRLCGRPVV